MNYKIISILLGFFFFGSTISYTQSIYTTKEEVIEYLVGDWNIDVVHGGFGGFTYYLPTPLYYDSTIHKIVFEKSEIDSTPLICKAFIDDTLFQTTYVSISENPSQVILPKWLLFNLPDNLESNNGIMESQGFYGFSQDTVVLSGNIAADGFEFGLTRLTISAITTLQYEEVFIYPNPSVGVIYISGITPNSSFKLYTIDGRFVKGGNVNGNTLKIEDSGIFILKIKIKNGWITKKIVNQSNS